MSELKFPDGFIWGTSTASYQIETAFEHDWKGVKAKDGFVFDRTTDHELRMMEDADLILNCAKGYRMSMQWSKLQREAMGPFDQEQVKKYRQFLDKLKSNGAHIMLVLHHFTDPLWFVKAGKWENDKCIDYFLDYVTKFVDEFGEYADSWNTFNEPNVFVSNGWIMGDFPPFKHSIGKAFGVIDRLGKAHDAASEIIRKKSKAPIGISHNTVCFKAEHWLGVLPAKLFDWWFMDHCAEKFKNVDFLGMSYYAKMPFIPKPITYIDDKEIFEKLGKPHDGMWEYYPDGMEDNIMRYWNLYKKPMIITESGVCTDDDAFRIRAMKDYIGRVHNCIQKGVDLRGYFWWSTWDNFEWNLGCSYRFGLYRTDFNTMNRMHTPSVDMFKKITTENKLIL